LKKKRTEGKSKGPGHVTSPKPNPISASATRGANCGGKQRELSATTWVVIAFEVHGGGPKEGTLPVSRGST